MVSIPAATPVTMPDVLMVAMEVVAALQAPPLAVSVRAIVDPPHTLSAPEIAPATGNGRTEMICVAVAVPQLLVTVYFMVSTPAAAPPTMPETLTVAMEVLDDDQEPLEEVSDSATLARIQMVSLPEIKPGSGIGATVTGKVTDMAPQLLEIV